MRTFLKRSGEQIGSAVVKDLLHLHVGGTETARGQTTIHASDLTKTDTAYCPREVFIRQDKGIKRRGQFLPVATATTFNEGRDKQWRLNNDWLVDIMVGAWHCAGCLRSAHDDPNEWSRYPKFKCSSCGVANWIYDEPRIIDHASLSTGGLDALIDIGQPKLRLIECKIMKGDNFIKLQAPLSEHRVRTRLYLRQVAGSRQLHAKEIETDFAHILYIMRGHGYKQEDGRISPFKEFVVTRDDYEVDHFIGMAHALTLSRTHSGVCTDGICTTQMDPRAKQCPVASTCFSGSYERNLTWYKQGVPFRGGDHIKYITDGEKLHECGSD